MTTIVSITVPYLISRITNFPYEGEVFTTKCNYEALHELVTTKMYKKLFMIITINMYSSTVVEHCHKCNVEKKCKRCGQVLFRISMVAPYLV